MRCYLAVVAWCWDHLDRAVSRVLATMEPWT